MNREALRRTRSEIIRLGHSGLDWATFATQASDALSRVIPFDRCCWHPVDPGTLLFTGSLTRNLTCSGSWLAEYEYVQDDVNKWSFLALSGYRAGALSQATHGNLSLSARYRSAQTIIGDELRASCVVDGAYWGATGFIRDPGQPWFVEEEVRALASLSEPMADGLRRALLIWSVFADDGLDDEAPGLVVFDDQGRVELISPAAERWIEEIVELPPPASPAASKVVQAVAAQAGRVETSGGRADSAARVRVQTRLGRWLTLYGTTLGGRTEKRIAVIIHPAAPHEVAPLVAQAYGLSERERRITRLCLKGLTTKEIAEALHISPYTVQDHLKSIFDKTGTRSRAELIGQVFLEHYASRFEDLDTPPAGWVAKGFTTD